jgi:multiple sugar transport system permease protein
MAQTATAPRTAEGKPPNSRRAGRSGSQRAERLMGFMMTLPGMMLLLFFLAIPFAMAIGLSVTNQRLGSPLPLRVVGLENYTETLGDPDFWKAFVNNLWFAAIVVPLQTGLALWLATLVNRRVKGIKVFRAIYFAPVVVVMAVAATIWLLLYSPERGLVNGFLRFISFGALESNWLDSTTMALPAIILMSMWQGAGFQMVILLAGLQDIPEELYEAASIDGATKWEQFRFVTVPQLRNTLLFVVTVTSILAFRLFDQVWVMTRGAPLGNTRTMMLEMVETGFERQQIARGSAIAVIFFLIVLTLTILQRLVIKEDTGQ